VSNRKAGFMISALKSSLSYFTLPSLQYFNYKKVYPKVSELAAWSENCEWYSSLPLDAVVSLFCVSV
jgi:hypothetical protein